MGDDIMSTEPEVRVPYDENSSNGLLLFEDKFIPDELMIEIFCHYIDHKSLKSCQLVCKRWNLLIQSYIWRKKAELTIHHSLPIDEDASWTMYYLICDKKPFYRNLIKNHSGEEGLKSTEVTTNRSFYRNRYVNFNDQDWEIESESVDLRSNWNVIYDGGHHWAVESPPVGVPPLPQDPVFKETNHCFVTSFGLCWKEQIIDLIKEGASDYLMDKIQPTIKVTIFCFEKIIF